MKIYVIIFYLLNSAVKLAIRIFKEKSLIDVYSW